MNLVYELLAIAILILLERKMIGYSQSRKGLNKILTMGITQPIADDITVLLEKINIMISQFLLYV